MKILIFDFDGTIIPDSEFGKSDAWLSVAEEIKIFLQSERSVLTMLNKMRERYAHAKGSRYDILRETFVELGLLSKDVKYLTEKFADRYNELVQEAIISLGVSEVDRRALKELGGYSPLYIISGTPELAIRETIEKLGMTSVFRGVLGQPNSKMENFQKIMAIENADTGSLVFVGDSDADYKTAREVGCFFIGRTNAWNKWVNPKSFPLIKNLSEITQLIA